MKAITLHEPWASLVAHGLKRVETRSWSTSHRGPLAIHAAVKWDRGQREAWALWAREYPQLGPAELAPRGAVVARARLVEVRLMTADLIEEQTALELSAGDWQPGRFAWVLEDVERLAVPVPVDGLQRERGDERRLLREQRVWNLPPVAEARVRQGARA